MADFTVDPDDVRIHGRTLGRTVAEDYAQRAEEISRDSAIDPPGFGIALSPFEALYIQHVGFLIDDVRGAADVCRQIGAKLGVVADQYERAEDLHVSGFGGTPAPMGSYGDAYGRTGAAQLATDPAALGAAATVGATITLAEIGGIVGGMAACAALCPTFIIGLAGAVLFVANPLGIAQAGADLIRHGDQLQKALNANFDKICSAATGTWKGEGKDSFVIMATKLKAHLDELGAYIRILGEALHSLEIALSGLWIALGAMTVPFLTWLIAMRAAELIPGAAVALEPLIQAAGAAVASSVTSMVAAVGAVGGLALALVNGLAKDFLKLMTLPDDGAAGTPDLTEFRVGENFA
ncbi:hypothetical protein O7598_27440 [Micromonospora sp. WMMC241]|uniref:hypothetical protein n=1 Tax=Micromonospora sp. WMMC241 TaxID=3015159 RepID=UPI0022B69B64|nr:hypothetical protein [Micromonospora sp. WMMC241]MCZ7440166.1 hypothetical protein [Micromonospora sp. WMMC241]